MIDTENNDKTPAIGAVMSYEVDDLTKRIQNVKGIIVKGLDGKEEVITIKAVDSKLLADGTIVGEDGKEIGKLSEKYTKMIFTRNKNNNKNKLKYQEQKNALTK